VVIRTRRTRFRAAALAAVLVVLATGPLAAAEEPGAVGSAEASPGDATRVSPDDATEVPRPDDASASGDTVGPGDAVVSGDDGAQTAGEPERGDEAPADTGFEALWSATLMAQFQFIGSPWDSDYLTDYFDQYEWTPNEGSALPVELGVRDAAFDWMKDGGTPIWQLRFRSPTSNLGVSGSQIDDPFLNQRADLVGRLKGVDVDLDYRRFRTSDLRKFPETLGRPYTDLTSPIDLFTYDRSGIAGEIRLRPADFREGEDDALERILAPELSFRGSYQSRPTAYQRIFLLTPVNTSVGIDQPYEDDASSAGGGILIVPGGALTLDLDVDYRRFDSSPTVLQGSVAPAVPPSSRSIGFVPDSERLAGQIRMHGRLFDRATLEGGFQMARVQQVGDRTPAQEAFGLLDNEVVSLSANGRANVRLAERWSVEALVKYDQRKNDLDRTTALFSPVNGTQVDEFLQRANRLKARLEVVHHPWRRQTVALGARYDAIDRTLDFADPVSGFPVLLAPNALVAEDTRAWTVYGRTHLRLLRRLQLRAEAGYRGTPDTGYITDLDSYVYGRARITYTAPTSRPLQLSAFASGGTGENRDFVMVSGIGPIPAGPLLPRDFEGSDYQVGLTASYSPRDHWSLFASFTYGSDSRNQPLAVSTLTRFLQPLQPISFANSGEPDWSNGQTSLILGTHVRIGEDSDISAAYSYTGIDAVYGIGVPSPSVALIAGSSAVRSDIQGLQLEAGHWVREGLRVLVGYRLQHLSDDSPMSSGQGSVVPPLPLGVTHQTITIGVTLAEALLKRAS